MFRRVTSWRSTSTVKRTDRAAAGGTAVLDCSWPVRQPSSRPFEGTRARSTPRRELALRRSLTLLRVTRGPCRPADSSVLLRAPAAASRRPPSRHARATSTTRPFTAAMPGAPSAVLNVDQVVLVGAAEQEQRDHDHHRRHHPDHRVFPACVRPRLEDAARDVDRAAR